MTRDRSTEEPCAAKVARTVLKTSGRGDPLAEFNRAHRFGVLWRKGSFGTQSPSGSRFVESIMTVVTTLKQQQRHLFGSTSQRCVKRLCVVKLLLLCFPQKIRSHNRWRDTRFHNLNGYDGTCCGLIEVDTGISVV